MVERRRHSRIKAPFLTLVRLSEDKNEEIDVACVRDVSSAGMYLYIQGEFPSVKPVAIEVYASSQLAGGEEALSLRGEGKVVRFERQACTHPGVSLNGIAIKLGHELSVVV